ncbi:MAG: hypothetical protein ACM32O_17760 [Clostridia bacterium]
MVFLLATFITSQIVIVLSVARNIQCGRNPRFRFSALTDRVNLHEPEAHNQYGSNAGIFP